MLVSCKSVKRTNFIVNTVTYFFHTTGGKTEKDMVRVDMLADQTMDLRNGLNRLVYNPRFVSFIC